jgi:hypothetical protein
MWRSADSGRVTWYRDELTRVTKCSVSVEPQMNFGQSTKCDNTAVPLPLEVPSTPAVRVVWGFQLHDNRQTDRQTEVMVRLSDRTLTGHNKTGLL